MPAIAAPEQPSSLPKTHKRYQKAIVQAIELQRVLFDEAMEPGVKPLERSSLARVWCELEETKRKLRMKPLPKAIDVTKVDKRGKPRETLGAAD